MRHAADIVIVGGGHGGAQAAIALRQQGFDGSILLVGRERELPYERPPLSKDYLSGEKPFERLLIRPASFWSERDIELWLGREVVQVDPVAQAVALSDGSRVAYGMLIWAAGGDPRRLSCDGSELAGIHAIRTRADVDQLVAELEGIACKVAIIGGGYIGLEAAAVLTKLGRDVVLLEALPQVLARVAGEALSAFYEKEHLAHGVDLRTNAKISHVIGSNGRVSGISMNNGAVVPVDLVIVGIGIAPNVGPLLGAGAKGTQQLGVEVDGQCRTSLANVFAIGDCAAHASPFADGNVIRLESVQNANDMASLVARTVCGQEQIYSATPWFWSNQYDLKLQTVGLSIGHDETVLRGEPGERAFSVVYLRKGKVIALDCVNRVKDYVQGRKLVEARVHVSGSRLADVTEPLSSMVGDVENSAT